MALHELRIPFRHLLKSPGFTTAAVLMLALEFTRQTGRVLWEEVFFRIEAGENSSLPPVERWAYQSTRLVWQVNSVILT
jgi:hypothetical protein